MSQEPRGADRVREVFARVARGDEGVADLYAEDGVVLAGGQRHEGREAVRTFYRDTIASLHPKPEVQYVLSDEGSGFYAAVVEVPLDVGHMHALDLFTIDDEGIRQLEIYARPIDDQAIDGTRVETEPRPSR